MLANPGASETHCFRRGSDEHLLSCLQVAEFYKVWDRYGALSNFSPHPVQLPDAKGVSRSWPTVEHFYQAQKFAGVNDPAAFGVQEVRVTCHGCCDEPYPGRPCCRQHVNSRQLVPVFRSCEALQCLCFQRLTLQRTADTALYGCLCRQ